jgi:hypothetical protein
LPDLLKALGSQQATAACTSRSAPARISTIRSISGSVAPRASARSRRPARGPSAGRRGPCRSCRSPRRAHRPRSSATRRPRWPRSPRATGLPVVAGVPLQRSARRVHVRLARGTLLAEAVLAPPPGFRECGRAARGGASPGPRPRSCRRDGGSRRRRESASRPPFRLPEPDVVGSSCTAPWKGLESVTALPLGTVRDRRVPRPLPAGRGRRVMIRA